jgi:hypothetical protein
LIGFAGHEAERNRGGGRQIDFNAFDDNLLHGLYQAHHCAIRRIAARFEIELPELFPVNASRIDDKLRPIEDRPLVGGALDLQSCTRFLV